MTIVRQILFVALLIGLILFMLAGACLLLLTLTKTLKSLPADSSTTAAWIGFAGNIAGTLITVLVAVVALWPAYKQMGESQRSSSVQAGQILRTRLNATKVDFAILLKGTRGERLPALLALDDPNMTREKWLKLHADRADEIRNNIIPRLEEIQGDLFNASAGTDLPDLDRMPYSKAVQRLDLYLYSVLDGIPRADNGAPEAPMTAVEWRAHIEKTLQFAHEDFSAAKLNYNNKINAAMQILRFQILQADKTAIGPEAYAQFAQWQKQMDLVATATTRNQ